MEGSVEQWHQLHSYLQQNHYHPELSQATQHHHYDDRHHQVYAPTSSHDNVEVRELYEQLNTSISKLPKKGVLLFLGDWNAKVGPDAYQHWAGVVGKSGIGETNDRGFRLLGFTRSHRLTLANMVHPHKKSRTTTWHLPNGQVHNQIDFILAPQSHKSSINKAYTRTFPGTDVSSDHNLVLSTFKMKLNSKYSPKSPCIHSDLGKLKDPEIVEVFQAQIGDKFAALNLLDSKVDTIKTSTSSSKVQTTAVHKKHKKIQPWITTDLCDKRSVLRKTKHSSDAARGQYQQANREDRKKVRAAKEEWIEDQCKSLKAAWKKGTAKRPTTPKILTKTSQPTAAVIENKDGKRLTDDEHALKRWTEYCDGIQLPALRRQLLSYKKTRDKFHQLLKNGGQETIKVLTLLSKKIWEQKKWPQEWTQLLVIPLPKKGNLRQCQNYRTISLISHPSKVMLHIILNQLKFMAEELLTEEQAGFRARQSTLEQIFNCSPYRKTFTTSKRPVPQLHQL